MSVWNCCTVTTNSILEKPSHTSTTRSGVRYTPSETMRMSEADGAETAANARSLADRKWYNCHKTGHLGNDCPSALFSVTMVGSSGGTVCGGDLWGGVVGGP